jgi:hypothetical protein
MSDRTVTAEPAAKRWEPDQGMTAATCRLRYEPTDPYAVTLGATHADGRPSTWTFARSLLADGAAGSAGIGDVRIWRVTSNDGLVAFSLSDPTGPVHLYVPLGPLAAFLAATNHAVAPGTEHLVGDLDAELAALLDDDG